MSIVFEIEARIDHSRKRLQIIVKRLQIIVKRLQIIVNVGRLQLIAGSKQTPVVQAPLSYITNTVKCPESRRKNKQMSKMESLSINSHDTSYSVGFWR